MATFTEQPSYTYTEEISYPVDTIEYESGKETRLLRSLPQRMFTLQYDAVTTATKDSVLAFFNARAGGFDSFLWTNPNDLVVYSVKFLEDTLTMNEVDYGYWSMNFKFIQNLDV